MLKSRFVLFRRGAWTAALASIALFALASASARLVPYCMDEFAHYHWLGCRAFPLTAKWTAQQQGLFREGCGSYDLRLPFTTTFLPLRAYHYIGSLPALTFFPFWKLFHDPVAARVQGAVFLVIATALLARVTRARFLDALLAASVWPVFGFAFLADLGPVGLSLVLAGSALLALRAAVRAERAALQIAAAALAGFAVFRGFWTKLVFAWVAPALLIFGWSEAREHRPERPLAGRARAALAAAIAAAVPSLLLLFASDADGDPYYSVLRAGHLSAADSVQDFGWHPFLRLSRYLYDGSWILPRTLTIEQLPIDSFPLAAAALALVIGRGLAQSRYLGMALATLLATLLTRSAWGPHHIAFTLFFLVGALGLAIGTLRSRHRRLPLALAVLSGLYWASIVARLPQAEIQKDSSFAKDALLETVRDFGLDRKNVQVHTSWGTYYIAHLFGHPAQIVVWAPGLPVKPDLIGEVKRIAVAEKRDIVMISRRNEANLVSDALTREFGEAVRKRRFDDWWLLEFRF